MQRVSGFVGIAVLGASLAGCASIPDSCRDLSGVRPVLASGEKGTLISHHEYASETRRVAHLHCLADQGAQSAQVELAGLYEIGQGVVLDPERAARLYERASTAVPPTTAIYSPPVKLGGTGRVIFLNNPNTTPGSAEAKYRLGLMLLKGKGVDRDVARGRSLIEDAAGLGHAKARGWLQTGGNE